MFNSYEKLIQKLEGFIKRYYYDKIIKGAAIFLLLSSGLFLLFSFIEFIGYWDVSTRAAIFFIYIGVNLFVFLKYIILPFLALIKLRKSLDHVEAAKIVGKYFKNEIDDKILNAIQLNSLINESNYVHEIVVAGIEQKSKKLISYQFSGAINLKSSLKFLPYAAFIIGMIILGVYFLPSLFKEPAKRIINYELQYSKPAPFSITILNSKLEAFSNEDYLLEIEVAGRNIPSDIFISEDKRLFRMNKLRKNNYNYTFKNLVNNIEFYFKGSNYTFGPYVLIVNAKPLIKSFAVSVEYPNYTGKSNEQFINAGDLRIPEGSKIMWRFFCENVDILNVMVDSITQKVEKERVGVFSLNKTIRNSFKYFVYTASESEIYGDSLNYFIEMIPDRIPLISVEEQRDETLISHTFFRGIINDDYGFSDLKFLYRVFNSKYNEYDNEDFNKKDVKFDKSSLNQTFYYHYNLNELDIRPGEVLEYYFMVWDNDGINGPKSAKSNLFSFQLPTYEEIIAESMAGDEKIQQDLATNIEDVKKAYDEIEDIKKSMLESENVTWEQEEAIKSLLEKQENLEKTLKEISDFSEKNESKSNQFKNENESIKEKHEELQKLINEVMNDEFRELMQKIREEMEKLGKQDIFEKLDQMKFEMKDLERRLDRMLELYKQLELEKILNESLNAIEKAIEEQQEAIEKLLDKESKEDIIEKQEEAKDFFELAEELLEKFEEKNKQLSKPNPTESTEDIQDEIRQNIENAIKELQNEKNNRARPHQQKSKENLDKMKQSLKAMQENLFKDSMFEDAKALRQLMENLLKTSFNQEELIAKVKEVNIKDPKYLEYIQEQSKILEDLKFVEDSLVALAKRQITVRDFVTREIAEINMNVGKAVEDLAERRKHAAASRQQFSMMHINNLVLLLNESLQNMMSQMASQSGEGEDGEMGGEGSKPSFKNMRQMQEQMNQMLEQMQKGTTPKPGESADGQMSVSERLARMAAEQQALRNQLKEIADQYSKDGMGSEDLEQIISDMERTELDIVRKNVTRQTLLRQEKILTRLLEHEKAEIEREKEEKRQGTTAKFHEISNPEDIFEYNRKRNRELEMLRSLPPEFKNYYRNLIENYFLNIDTE
jgi:hypothetical protein